eukprot:TRINITY_DN8429_c1_g1_i1.p1 TRINITY_DN8429_c1_g1~~TRINITY_DN8429_c1_g1_i1.p1  ORF type:complete len:118 (+),score=11.47 TRINITY_DN8429_c1_g1_i1:522-875(+)
MRSKIRRTRILSSVVTQPVLDYGIHQDHNYHSASLSLPRPLPVPLELFLTASADFSYCYSWLNRSCHSSQRTRGYTPLGDGGSVLLSIYSPTQFKLRKEACKKFGILISLCSCESFP